MVDSGKLKAYAVISKKPFIGLPKPKTMTQLGYEKLDIDFWHMLLAPAGTFEVAESTVSKYMIKHRGPPSQTWRTFLRNHADAIASIDVSSGEPWSTPAVVVYRSPVFLPL